MLLEYFQMIDAVEDLDPDNGSIIARADVPMKSTVFEGHFPGSPLVPGVLLIETMAQQIINRGLKCAFGLKDANRFADSGSYLLVHIIFSGYRVREKGNIIWCPYIPHHV